MRGISTPPLSIPTEQSWQRAAPLSEILLNIQYQRGEKGQYTQEKRCFGVGTWNEVFSFSEGKVPNQSFKS